MQHHWSKVSYVNDFVCKQHKYNKENHPSKDLFDTNNFTKTDVFYMMRLFNAGQFINGIYGWT